MNFCIIRVNLSNIVSGRIVMGYLISASKEHCAGSVFRKVAGVIALFCIGWAQSGDGGLLEYERNTIDVYEKTKGSVVYIESRRSLRGLSLPSGTELPRGSGSGVIWDREGHVVTNYHVIQNADSVMVFFDRDKQFKAELIGIDSTKDLAVLKVDAPENLLDPVRVGDKQDLVVGRKALALGNPFGLQKTLTVGVISALGRQIRASETRTIRHVIQTDAVINPGNSGGPLLDSQARLIGVNTAIVSRGGANTGIGFAIPVHTVKRVVPELIEHGVVRRAGLGITTLRDKASELYPGEGVVILNVPQGSPAQAAGLRGVSRDSQGKTIVGDVIVKINDTVIRNNDDLAHFLEEQVAGDLVQVTVKRENQEHIVACTLVQIN
ncbi:trypsin-like peptidase domain-containing protein [Chitinispirillales bacterium ANBcel5]|uniref:S1C family serine protease n=1 Tax=Cellulosispirillum alkaliphilum TaxID=3039283 RepID=UPI002A52162B|nr:trypsin-like peptidase domain-containing protein [Chitinispirillales bacterium ANBcel5]